jgi:hypothetical protein
MLKDSLSERDRVRLAELMRAPLLAPRVPAESPQKQNQWRSGFERSLHRARHKLSAWWNVSVWPGSLSICQNFAGTLRSAEPIGRHLAVHWRAWSAGAAVMAVCLVVLGGVVKIENRRGEASIQLQALDRQGQLQIRWDPESDVVRRATGAKLFIIDGSQRLYVKLDGTRLRRGAVNYPRRSDRVELRLALAEPDGRMVEQQATFVVTRPANRDQSQWVAAVKPGPAPSETPAAPAPAAQPGELLKPATVAEHRARRKPLVQSGTSLPFICSTGDVFHKTDAPPGWDTFSCRGKNVWSVMKNQAREDRPANKPSANATTLTAKPAPASTT